MHTVRGSEPHTPAGRAPLHPSHRERKVNLSKQERGEVADKHRAGFCELSCHRENTAPSSRKEREMVAKVLGLKWLDYLFEL